MRHQVHEIKKLSYITYERKIFEVQKQFDFHVQETGTTITDSLKLNRSTDYPAVS